MGTGRWAISGQETASVAVLFVPSIVPIIDVFRALADFQEHYDIGALDELEGRLCASMSRDLAKGLVSDALLLAFGLGRERTEPLAFRPLFSRRGSLDEYRLMGMIGATFENDSVLAAATAASLGINPSQPLISLAFDVARRLKAAGLRLGAPDRRLLGLQPSISLFDILSDRASRGDMRRRLDV
jgi:hypothetical protein